MSDLKNWKICSNENCTKSHCARYVSVDDFSEVEDFNPDNKFKCPNYIPRFKGRGDATAQRQTITAVYHNGKCYKQYND